MAKAFSVVSIIARPYSYDDVLLYKNEYDRQVMITVDDTIGFVALFCIINIFVDLGIISYHLAKISRNFEKAINE